MIIDKYFEDFAVGETVVSPNKIITDDSIRSYCISTQLIHPLHLDTQACLEQFGRANLMAPGVMIVGFVDGVFSQIVSPTKPFSPHYGYDKIRFIKMVFGGDILNVEFKLVGKSKRDKKYGMLTFETYVKNQDGDPVIFCVDKLAVPYRELTQ
jgi:acyl dehydratase